MKVLHVCPYMHPSAGGPPVVVERYCELSPSHGWAARAITTSLMCDDDGSDLQRALSEHIEVEVLPVDRPRLMGLSSRARASIAAAVQDSDLVHVHTLWHPLGAMVRKSARKYGRPYVTMPHGMLDPYALSVNPRRKRLYLWLVERANLEGAQRIIYTSGEEKRPAIEMFPWLPPGVVALLGADDPPAISRGQLRRSFLERFPMATGRRCLLFLGRLHPKKGLDHILDVMPALACHFPNVLLIVAGGGAPGYMGTLHRRVQMGGVREHVLFTGPLEGKAKWGAFATAEVFVLPSRQENFAISVAEAMRMAVPVVITDRVNSWPYVEEAKAGIILKWNDIGQLLLKRIAELLEDAAMAHEMGANGKSFASRKLNWQSATQRIIACYESVLGTSSQEQYRAVDAMRSAPP